MGVALTKYLANVKTAPVLAAGALLCASVFVSPAAWADDSLWGKTMNVIGLGGNGQSSQDSANPPQAAQPSLQAAPKPPQAAPKPVAAAPQPTAQAPQPTQEVAVTQVPGQNLLSDWFGLGRSGNSTAVQGASSLPSSAGPQQKAINPVSASVSPPPPPPPAPRAAPSMWDNLIGSVGVGNGAGMDSINYNDRPKLAVPKERNLPQPAPGAEPAATRGANSDALVKPPSDYLEKVRGSDGNVSGLRDSDMAKDKKIFGIF